MNATQTTLDRQLRTAQERERLAMAKRQFAEQRLCEVKQQEARLQRELEDAMAECETARTEHEAVQRRIATERLP